MSFIQCFHLPRRSVKKEITENMKSTYCIQERTRVPEFDQESIGSISSLKSLNVSPRFGPDDFLLWYRKKNEPVSRYVIDMKRFESSGPERLTAVHSVTVGELGMWGLERYQDDREDFPQMTVEEIEDEMGINRPWNYGIRPEWDWLFAGMWNTSDYYLHLPYVFDKKAVNEAAKVDENILAALKKSMNTKRTLKSRSGQCVMGGGDGPNEAQPTQPMSGPQFARIVDEGQSKKSKQNAEQEVKGVGHRMRKSIRRRMRGLMSIFH